MAFFPLVVTIIAGSFACVLGSHYVRRRKPHQLVWALALVLGAIAGLAFVLFLLTDRNAWFFRLYYLSGALLMAAYLGVGSCYLLVPRQWAHRTAIAVTVLGAGGTLALFTSPVSQRALDAPNVEAGTHAVRGAVIVFVVALNTFGALAVTGGALLSAWRLWQRHGPLRLLIANVCIASGTILASFAGTAARVTGDGSFFWVILAGGFCVLFVGFSLATLIGVTAPRGSDSPASTP